MRKFYLVLMVLGLLLAGFAVAQAAAFDIEGKITGISYDAKTLVVNEYTITVTAETVVVICQEAAAFEQLTAGDYVKIKLANVPGPTAKKICVPCDQIIE